MKSFPLNCPRVRRRMAPAPALTNISTAGRKWSTPKITESAAAPAAAANAKSHVGDGGAREITPIAFIAASGASRPDSTSSIAHRRSDAVHLHAGRIGRYLAEWSGLAIGLKL